MPATLTIKTSRSGVKAIDYSSARNNHDKAHNGYAMKRVLAASGVNCTPKDGKAKMQEIWRKKKTKQKHMKKLTRLCNLLILKTLIIVMRTMSN